jgi:hypothetical protein
MPQGDMDIRQRLDAWSQILAELIGRFADENLPDSDRRKSIIALRSMLSLHRKWLREADLSGEIPPAEVSQMRLECVGICFPVCERQERELLTLLDSPGLSSHRHCALVHTYCTTVKMCLGLQKELEEALGSRGFALKRWERN